jgi:hypothetical protein
MKRFVISAVVSFAVLTSPAPAWADDARSAVKAAAVQNTASRCDRRLHTKRRARRPRRAPAVSAAYRRKIAEWHRPAPARQVKAWLRDAPPLLVLKPVGKADLVSVRPTPSTGEFSELALGDAATALAHKDSGAVHPIHPRLLKVLYRAVRFFRTPYVWVVSGYRPERATSRHGQGRAIDFILPGVPNARLAKYLRQQGFVGVGVYPQSGFVHLDVREQSYFWTDRSAPGEAQRSRPMLKALARTEDRKAKKRGEEPVPDLEPTDENETQGEAPSDLVLEPVREADPSPVTPN